MLSQQEFAGKRVSPTSLQITVATYQHTSLRRSQHIAQEPAFGERISRRPQKNKTHHRKKKNQGHDELEKPSVIAWRLSVSCDRSNSHEDSFQYRYSYLKSLNVYRKDSDSFSLASVNRSVWKAKTLKDDCDSKNQTKSANQEVEQEAHNKQTATCWKACNILKNYNISVPILPYAMGKKTR